MISKYLISLLALTASVPLAQSVPAEATVLDVWVPKILYPNKDTVWTLGSSQHASWDVTNAPSQITNPLGRIYTFKNGAIQFEHKLVGGFKISDGRVEFEVPHDITPGKYQIVLMGDSGNISDEFTIAKH